MIVYASRTGNVRHIVNKLEDVDSVEISNGLIVKQPYILFTYTDNLGGIPQVVIDFLKSGDNSKYIKGVIASGNRNFGHDYFCASATKISSWLKVPIIRTIDLRGEVEDIEEVNKQYKIIIKGEAN